MHSGGFVQSRIELLDRCGQSRRAFFERDPVLSLVGNHGKLSRSINTMPFSTPLRSVLKKSSVEHPRRGDRLTPGKGATQILRLHRRSAVPEVEKDRIHPVRIDAHRFPDAVVVPGQSTSAHAAHGTHRMLTRNSFLKEINKQFVRTARSIGLDVESASSWGTCSATPSLIVIAGSRPQFVGRAVHASQSAAVIAGHFLDRRHRPSRLRSRRQARPIATSARCSVS